MKKIFTTLFTLLGFLNLALAQQKSNIEFGLGAGVGYSFIYQENNNSEIKLALNAGAFADYYFSDSWSLKVKAMYDQKGWSDGNIYVTDEDNGNQATIRGVDFRLNYITIPVTAEWHFGRTSNWYLNFGPYVGFLTSSTSSIYVPDLKDNYNTVDAGISFAVGVKIPISRHQKFFIESDGQSGVTNIFKYSDQSNQNLRQSINIGIDF